MTKRILLSGLFLLMTGNMALSQNTAPPPLTISVSEESIRIENPTDQDYHLDMFFLFHDEQELRLSIQPKDITFRAGETTTIALAEFEDANARDNIDAAPTMLAINVANKEGLHSLCIFPGGEDGQYRLDEELSSSLTAIVRKIPGYKPVANKK